MNKPKVKEISRTLFEVNGHSVKIQTRRGRKLLLCDCINHTKFCLENPFCWHKELVAEHISKKTTKKELDKLIDQYKIAVEIKGLIEPRTFLNDLKNLRRILLK